MPDGVEDETLVELGSRLRSIATSEHRSVGRLELLTTLRGGTDDAPRLPAYAQKYPSESG